MRLLNPLRIVSVKSVKTLSKHLAIPTRVFEPAIIKDKAITGHNEIVYRDEPTWIGKTLCPSYFKYRDYLKSSLLDPFQDTPDIVMWSDIQKPFKLYSKVIFDTNYKGVTIFKIQNIQTESDDSGNFIHKHFLIPLYEVQESHISESAMSEIFDTDSITEYDETRDSTIDVSEVKKFVYNPIK